MPPNKEFTHAKIPLDGRLILAEDPVNIGTNFQELINLRYTDARLKAVKGMSKMNPSIINATYPKIRSIHQMRKSVPVESHVLVQAFTSDLSQSEVMLSDDFLPTQSDFFTTPVWDDAAGAQRGYFADGPQGQLIYCNGQESVIWGGYESELGAFIHFKNNDDTISKDYGDQLRSIDRDADGIAVLDISGTGDYLDLNTVLMLHCDGANNSTTITDSSPTTPHTMTAHGNAKLTTSVMKFGTAALICDGTTDYITAPDDPDFDFSGGTWTVDTWIRLLAVPSGSNKFILFYQQTDSSNYWQVYLATTGTQAYLGLQVFTSGSATIDIATPAIISAGALWYHVAAQQNGSSFSLFINGSLKASLTDATTGDWPANYTGTFNIGAGASGASSLNGYMDEIRVSNVARYVSDFTPNSSAYASGSTTTTSFYIGSTRPIESFKVYVQVPNTTANAMNVYYWDGSEWDQVTNKSDGTVLAGASLGQTGIVSFDSTDGLAKIKQINGTFLCWYKVDIIPAVDSTTAIYYVTLQPPWQTLKDVWDGTNRDEISFFRLASGKYQDWTPNVLEDNYTSLDTGTYASFTMATSDFMYAGFVDRTRAIQIKLIPTHENTAANSQIIVEYWNGIAWTAVSGLDDGTSVNSITLSKSGIISWDSPDEKDEFKYDLLNIPVVPQQFSANPRFSGRGPVPNTVPVTAAPGTVLKPINQNTPQLYFYRFSFSKATSALQVFYISGIPSPNPPKGYSYSFQADNRQWLCDERLGDRNKVTVCSANAPDVWNGDDTTDFFFGNDERVTCGTEFYIRTADAFTTLKVIFKDDEMHAVSGLTINDYQQLVISTEIGCPAPDTLKVVKWKKGIVLIWQSSHGLYFFDGISPIDISNDLRQFFTDGIITPSMLGQSSAFIDELNKEYHWIFSTDGATLNREFVYDLERSSPSEGINKWFEIDRTTGLKLTCGTNAIDSLGAHYTLGCLDTGYVEILENGTNFDGQDIVCDFWTGDISMLNDILTTATLRAVKLISKAKTVTANKIIPTFYADGENVASITFPTPLEPNKAGYRVVDSLISGSFGPATFFSFKYSLTTNDELGFEPLILAVSFKEATSDV